MREQHMKPLSRMVGLHNYLPHKFTFYWDKEPYSVEAGETLKVFEWLAVHAAVKLAEEWFELNPTNKGSKDPKVRGFYSRHDDIFKEMVRKAIVIPEGKQAPEASETSNAIAAMNQPEPERKSKPSIELPEVEDEIVEGCKECKATGPRHKPTCPKYKKHEKDEAQAAKLREAAS